MIIKTFKIPGVVQILTILLVHLFADYDSIQISKKGVKFKVSQSKRQIIGFFSASSLGGLALIFGGLGASAATIASTTGSIGVTISNSGSVGTVTTPSVVRSTTSSTSTGLRIVTPPPPSASSALGSSPVAPVGSTEGNEAEADSASSSSTGASGANAEPAFSSPGVSSAGLGAASAVQIAGAPNQTFSITLPEATTFAQSGQLVTLSNFQHNAGNTPFLGKNGSGVFNVGAQVNQQSAPATVGPTSDIDPGDNDEISNLQGPVSQIIAAGLSDADLIGGDRATVMASAFTLKSPFVNIVVSYN